MRNEETAEVVRLLGIVYRRARRRAQPACGDRPNEFPGVAWLILRIVKSRPGQTVSGLARAAGLSKSRVSVVVDQLEERALLEKRHDPLDQRLVRLYGTGRMPESWEAGRAAYEGAMAELLDGLEAEERRALLAILRKMCAAVEDGAW